MDAINIRFPGGKAKALTLSYDDNKDQDIRLIEILRRHGLKATFNLNSGLYAPEGTVYPPGEVGRVMTERQVTETYKDSGMEVAVHCLTHPHLEQLPTAVCTYEVVKDRENLERQFGRIVRGMAYPFGTYSDAVVDVLKSAGIVYARTTYTTGKFDIPADWLRLPATCHHNDPRLMELAKQFVEEKPRDNRPPWLFYVWGHSYEFEIKDNWHVIEDFAAYIGGKDDIWYATNIEIYEYIEAWGRLVFSMDENVVQNPTARTLWLHRGCDVHVIEPGETVQL